MRFSYVWRELSQRRRRHLTAIFGLCVGIALLLTLNALAVAYREAAREPLKEIGADISVQRSGDVPQELQGAVFPCSAVTIRQQEVLRIGRLPGVRGVGTALLLWVFDKEQFTMLMGLDPAKTMGPGALRKHLVKGRFLDGPGQALLDETYAKEKGLDLGDTVRVLDKSFHVVGLVAAARASKIAVANVYTLLAEAQALAEASPQVQAVSPFDAGDVNLVFLEAEHGEILTLAATLKATMGDKIAIATPESFLRRLGSLFALSDKFASAASLLVLLVAFLMVFKTIAGNIQERAKEIAVLKCLGWSNGSIVWQLSAEALTLCLLAGVLGVLIAWLAMLGLSAQELRIPIPWEMSPTPHFLPGGGDPVFKTLLLPARLSWPLVGLALALSLLVGGVASALCVARITRIKPSEVLRHE